MELQSHPANDPGTAGLVLGGHFDGPSPPTAGPSLSATTRRRMVFQEPCQLFRCAGLCARSSLEKEFLHVPKKVRQPKTPEPMDEPLRRLAVLCPIKWIKSSLEPVWKFRGSPVFAEKAGWRGAPREDTRSGLRPRSNEARRPSPRKPFGRRVFCPWPALARPSQPDAGMLRSRRLGHSQNPSPQDPTQFPNRLLNWKPRMMIGINKRENARQRRVFACDGSEP